MMYQNELLLQLSRPVAGEPRLLSLTPDWVPQVRCWFVGLGQSAEGGGSRWRRHG